jgi:hypothetical protein
MSGSRYQSILRYHPSIKWPEKPQGNSPPSARETLAARHHQLANYQSLTPFSDLIF